MAADKQDDDARIANDRQEQSSGNTKRARISQACEPCRAKKCKCDGQYPICGSCRLDRGQVCLYDPHPKKRGLPAGLSSMLDRQVRILELICATLYDHIEYAAVEEDPPGAEKTDSARLRDVTSSETVMRMTPTMTSARSDNDSTVRRLDRWRACPISRFVENASKDFTAFERFWQDSDALLKPLLPRILPLVQIHPAEEAVNNIHPPINRGTIQPSSPLLSESLPFVGDDSQQSNSSLHMPPNLPSSENHKSYASNNLMSLKDTTDVSSPAISSLSHMSSHVPKGALSYHILPRNTTRLLDAYFTYTHTWLPMVDKFKLVSFTHGFSTEILASYSSAARGRLAILWAIIAYASFQIAAPDSVGDDTSSSGRDITAPEAAYRMARALIPAEDQKYELEHVQALILLSLINIGKSAWTTSWLLMGMAGRIAQDLGLESKLSPQNSYQRRTFLACFVIDGLISAHLNRRPQLHKRAVQVSTTNAQDSQHLEEEGWEEWSLWDGSRFAATSSLSSGWNDQFPVRSLNTFNHLLRLIHIMNDITSVEYDGMSLKTIEALHIAFSKQLEQWRDGLDAHCALISSNDVDIRLPHVLNLHLVFCSAICLLRHRVTIYQHNNLNWTTNTTSFLDLEFHRLRHHIDSLLSRYQSSYTLRLAPPTFVLVMDLVIQHTSGAKVHQAPLSNSLEEMKQIWTMPASSLMNGNSMRGSDVDDLNEQQIPASKGHNIPGVGSSSRVENIKANSDNVSQAKTISPIPITDFFDKLMSDAASLQSSAYSLDMSPCYPIHQYEGRVQQQTVIDNTEISSDSPHQGMMATTLAAVSQQQNEVLDLQGNHLPEPTAPRLDYINSFGGNPFPTPKLDSQQQHLSNAYSGPINPVTYNNTILMATLNADVQNRQMSQIQGNPSLSNNKAIISDPGGLVNASRFDSNLAALDAIDWNDDRFMKNLGYHRGNM